MQTPPDTPAAPSTAERKYYEQLMELIELCTPRNYIYSLQTGAARESEEVVMICRAALSVAGLSALMISASSLRVKKQLLHFTEHIHGITGISEYNEGELALAILEDVRRSVQFLGAVPDQSTTLSSPQISYIVRPISAFMQLENSDEDDSYIDLAYAQFEEISPMVYLFESALPFVTALFQILSLPDHLGGSKILDEFYYFAKHLVEEDSSRVTSDMAGVLINCLLVLFDPQGAGYSSGVPGDITSDEFKALLVELCKLYPKLHASESFAHHSGSDAQPPMLSEGQLQAKLAVTIDPIAEISQLLTAVKTDPSGVPIRKIISLLGEFSGFQLSKSMATPDPLLAPSCDWTKRNVTKFYVSFLILLQHSILDSPDHTEEKVQLISYHVCWMLVSIVAERASKAIVLQALRLATLLLKDGFHTAQTAFLEQVRDGKAETARSFLCSLRDLMYHCQDPGDSQEDDAAANTSWELFSETMLLMQELCEGHYIPWQNTLRQQPHFSVDLVSEATAVMSRLVQSYGPVWYILVYWWATCGSRRLSRKASAKTHGAVCTSPWTRASVRAGDWGMCWRKTTRGRPAPFTTSATSSCARW
eukprot:NODE_165_length_2841_cov_9.157701_g153_i0.p1 GENE.NODE_165_length_2841_cov_9.157701_g153_i0~~NODE_165_length_2841_cov_9.157701_g153_i0.p1  ORF type:complete len:592 (-),score=134.29 NODE_165_length_2841_cov_9.157701_g153_i0:398-2173(-)